MRVLLELLKPVGNVVCPCDPTFRELGIGIVAFNPLGRGFLTGRITSVDDLAEQDMRRTQPRFRDEAFDANLNAVDVVRDIADGHGARPGQVALAWLLAKGPDVVPIPGTKRRGYLEDNVRAVDLDLTSVDVAVLAQAFPRGVAAGPRHNDDAMQLMNG